MERKIKKNIHFPGEIGTKGPSPPCYYLLPKITKKYSFPLKLKISRKIFPPFCDPCEETTILSIIFFTLV